MEISTKVTNAGVWVSMRGPLDAVSVQKISRDLDAVFQYDRKNLLVDFIGVTEVAPAGLRSLLPYVQKVHQHKMELILFNLNDTIQRLVKNSGFDSLVVVVDSLDSAIAYALRKNIKNR